MKPVVLCLLVAVLISIIAGLPTPADRVKRGLHHSKLKVKIVHRGPLGLKKRKFRYNGYGHGGGLGQWSGHGGYGGYGGYGGHGSYGWPQLGGGHGSSYAHSFSSPFGNYASASAIGR